MKINDPRLRFLCTGLVVGVLVGAAGIYILSSEKENQMASVGLNGLRESQLNPTEPYHYIDPLLAVSGLNPLSSEQYGMLQNDITLYINQQIENGTLNAASVYMRDFNTTSGFSLNADQQYNPASLLKVPELIVFYKLAEDDPELLNERIVYTGLHNADAEEVITSPVQLQPGTSYTIEELIEHMIEYSDNNAADLLTVYLNQTGHNTDFTKLFNDLGINSADIGNDFMTIRAASLFFKILYNATYLDRPYSEKALELLSHTDFTKGLSIGVPNDTNIAQKFGEFSSQTSTGLVLKRELSNCGIVYYPKHPFLLCVMTKGNDFPHLEDVIGTVSTMVYEYTEKTYGH